MRNAMLSLLATTIALTAAPAHAEWDFNEIVDPMSDARRGIANTPSGPIVLVVKCDRNGPGTIYLSFIADQYLGGTSRNSGRDIQFRIDGAPAERISARHDGRTASIFNLSPDRSGGQFLRRIVDASELTISLTNFRYESTVHVIDVSGARAAITQVAQTCNDTDWLEALQVSTP